jgi:hypothetical protein
MTASAMTACHTLDGFTDAVTRADGLSFRDVEPLTTLIVRTRNSLYRIVTSGDGAALVQGGSFFPDATPARIEGSGFGGNLLKMAWIGIGLRMEIFANGQRIITSPVRDISIEHRGSSLLH